MKPSKPVVLLSILYVLHLVCKFAAIPVPIFVSSYFADLLCMPLLLSVILLAMRKTQGQPTLKLSWQMVLFACFYVSVAFEFLLPRLDIRYTSDPKDMLIYFIGGCIFFFFQTTLVPLD